MLTDQEKAVALAALHFLVSATCKDKAVAKVVLAKAKAQRAAAK